MSRKYKFGDNDTQDLLSIMRRLKNMGNAVHEMMQYSGIIRKKLEDGTLRISENGLRFEGDLMLTR